MLFSSYFLSFDLINLFDHFSQSLNLNAFHERFCTSFCGRIAQLSLIDYLDQLFHVLILQVVLHDFEVEFALGSRNVQFHLRLEHLICDFGLYGVLEFIY